VTDHTAALILEYIAIFWFVVNNAMWIWQLHQNDSFIHDHYACMEEIEKLRKEVEHLKKEVRK
jgi:hypothetical protein